LGIRDYFKKTGFTKAFIGLSGGIDSALVAVLAAEALKPENVYGILMPSKYSSDGSIQDSKILADNLKIQSQQIAIEKILENFLGSAGLSELTLAEENLQARIRGSLLMALANENKALVLATGNKSEFAVGYSTLYGDMCGALAPIGDLWKTQVWELAKICPEIPQSIIDKPPSAELRPNQLDCDSLPDYALLDQILKGFIEKGLSVKQLQNQGLPLAEIEKVFKLFSSVFFLFLTY
jgi:NAD+ synthase (glutamine-hydrolysing)